MARNLSDAFLTCFSDFARSPVTSSAKSRELLRVVWMASLASAAFALRSSMRFCASAAREDETYQTIPPAATARIATIATAPSMIILPMVICFLPSDAGVPASPVSSAS